MSQPIPLLPPMPQHVDADGDVEMKEPENIDGEEEEEEEEDGMDNFSLDEDELEDADPRTLAQHRLRCFKQGVDELLAASPYSNHIHPLAEGSWTHGISTHLYANIQRTRFPVFPQANHDLFAINDKPYPIELPRRIKSDITKSAFEAEPLRVKAAHRYAADQPMTGSQTWQLRSIGIDLPMRPVREWEQRVLSNRYINPAYELSVWTEVIDGYRPVIPSNSNEFDFRTWLRYACDIQGSEMHVAEGVLGTPGRLAIFAASEHNSWDHFELLIQQSIASRRVQYTATLVLGTMYMVCIQFWMLCRRRFMMRTGYEHPDRPPYIFVFNKEADMAHTAADRTNLPLRRMHENFELCSGVVQEARRTPLWAFAAATLRHPSVERLLDPLQRYTKVASSEAIQTFLSAHIYANRDKCILSRGTTFHTCEALRKTINGLYSVSSASSATSMEVMKYELKQHPSGDSGYIRIAHVMFPNSDSRRALESHVPTFASHAFISAEAPLLTLAPSGLGFALKQQGRDLAYCVRELNRYRDREDEEEEGEEKMGSPSTPAPAPVIHLHGERVNVDSIGGVFEAKLVRMIKKRKQKPTTAETTATSTATPKTDERAMWMEAVRSRATVTQLSAQLMQFLPFLIQSHTSEIDAIILRLHEQHASTLVRARYTLRDQHFERGWAQPPTLTLHELPITDSKALHVRSASMPRWCAPRLPSESAHRYSCYFVRRQVGAMKSSAGSAPPFLYRHVREYDMPHPAVSDSTFLPNCGDHHILSMDRLTWRGLFEAALEVRDHCDSAGIPDPCVQRVEAFFRHGVVPSKRYFPLDCLDALRVFGETNYDFGRLHVKHHYPLFVLLSYYVTSELELIGCWINVYESSRPDTLEPNDADDVLAHLQTSARTRFETAVDTIFRSSALRPLQLTRAFRNYTGDHRRPVKVRPIAATYALVYDAHTGRATSSSSSDVKAPIATLYQLEIYRVHHTRTSHGVDRAIRNVYSIVNAICSNESLDDLDLKLAASSSHEEGDSDILPEFQIGIGLYFARLYTSSGTFREHANRIVQKSSGTADALKEACECTLANNRPWEMSLRMTMGEAVALAVLWFNAHVLDHLSILMDFQLPTCLVDGENAHWSSKVAMVDVLDPLTAHHTAMQQAVSHLAATSDALTRGLNETHTLPQESLIEWAEKQRPLFLSAYNWLVAHNRQDPEAERVKSVYGRINTILGVRESTAATTTTTSSSSASSLVPSNERTRQTQRVCEFIEWFVGECMNAKATLQRAPKEFGRTILYRLCIATNEVDPVKIKAHLRSIVLHLYTLNAPLAEMFRTIYGNQSVMGDIRHAFLPPPPPSHALSPPPPALFASSSSSSSSRPFATIPTAAAAAATSSTAPAPSNHIRTIGRG